MATDRFQPVKPDPLQEEAIRHVRAAFERLEETLSEFLPKCREASVCLTNIETAAMWATKAITHGETK